MATLRFFLLIFALIGSVTYAVGAGSRHFGVSEGLANRQTHEVCQDTAGFIWVNSISGVQRFDGREFRSYDMPGVMPSQDYWRAGTRFGIDRQGRFRVALRMGQLFEYNADNDAFDLVFNLREAGVNAMIENVIYDVSTYLCTGDGLYCLDNAGNISQRALKGLSVFDLAVTGYGVFYAATNDGVYRLSPTTPGAALKATRLQGIDSNRVPRLLRVDNILYVGTFADGLYAVDLDTDKVRRIPLPIDWLPVYSLLETPEGNVLVGQDGAGIYTIDPSDGRVLGHLGERSTPCISANTVKDICLDRDGGLWVTTTSDGLNYISPATKSAWFTRSAASPDSGLCSDFVNVVYEDADGEMWYGTDKGVSHCDRNNMWTHYLAAANGANTQVLSLDQAPDGRIWVGGYGMDVYAISKADRSVMRLPKGPADSGLTTKYVFRVLCEGDNVWIGGIQGDVVRYNTRTASYRRFNPSCIADMATDGAGTVFVGGCDGVGIYRPEADSVAIYMTLDTISFTHPMRTFAYDGRRSELWIASDGDGIMRYTPSTGAIRRFDFNGRLSDASINTVVCDCDGRVWFFTVREAFVIDADRQKVVNMTPVLGIGDAEFLFGTAVSHRDGNISVGTTKGAFTFNPRMQFYSEEARRIILNDLKVHHELVRPGDDSRIISVCLDRTPRIELASDQSTFSISFSMLNFNESQRLEMRYMLEGYDSRWLPAPASCELIYKNVEPGDYRLYIQAYDSFTDCVAGERTVDVRVLPPLWLRWWAVCIYAVLGAFLAWYILRRIRIRQNEHIVNSQIQSLLGLAHDLRAPISLIKAPLSEIESRETLSPDSLDNLRLAKANTDKLLEMLSRLLDLQRYRADEEKAPEPVDIAEFLNIKATEYRLSALQKSDTITVSADAALPRIICHRDILSHIIDNLLSNAVKYTRGGAITLSGAIVKDKVTIGVSDTGCGISRRDRRRIFRERFRGAEALESNEPGSGMGLLIVHRLARLLGGTVKINSREGAGTTVVLAFPFRPALAETAPVAEPAPLTEPESGVLREHILIAEDDADLRAYLTKSLSEQYEVSVLDTTADVVGQVRAVNPDIVITDVVMPGMNGIDVCKTIRNDIDTSHIPVIILSAMAAGADVVAGLEAGANDYIVKPFDMTILRLRIRNILIRQRRLQQSITAPAPAIDSTDAPEAPEFNTDLDKQFMETVNHLIELHLADQFYTITNFCRDLGMSRTSAYNKIRRLTGESINDYINIVRLDRAKEMLATQLYSVSEVAYTVGFSDPKYFSTCFRKRFGIAPSKL